jgi:hypothetical protein
MGYSYSVVMILDAIQLTNIPGKKIRPVFTVKVHTGLHIYESAFSVCQSHICDTAQIGHMHNGPHIPQHKTVINVTTLGTATPTPAGVGLNPDDKGCSYIKYLRPNKFKGFNQHIFYTETS